MTHTLRGGGHPDEGPGVVLSPADPVVPLGRKPARPPVEKCLVCPYYLEPYHPE